MGSSTPKAPGRAGLSLCQCTPTLGPTPPSCGWRHDPTAPPGHCTTEPAPNCCWTAPAWLAAARCGAT
eukprot:7043672-Alexandrium_andersonii.AAC.1